MQPIHARQAGKPQVRDHEPLPARRHEIGINPRHAGAQGIDPGGLACQSLGQRQAGGQVLVDLLGHLGRTGPDFGAHFGAELPFLIVAHRLAEIAVLHRAQQVAVGHAIKRQVQPVGVHRFNRNGHAVAARQDIAPARKAHAGIAVADIGGDLDRLGQNLPIGGGKSGAEGDGLAAAVGHAFDAKLTPAVKADRKVGGGKLHEGGVIHAGFHQIFREIRADARAGAVGLHLIVDDPKAIKPRDAVKCCCRIVARLQRLGQPQRLNAVAAPVKGFKRLGHLGQQRMLQAGIVGAQIAVHGGEIGLFMKGTAVVLVCLARSVQ